MSSERNIFRDWAFGDTGDDHDLKVIAIGDLNKRKNVAFVSKGQGIVDGTFYVNDAVIGLPISTNDSDKVRMDAIVLRKVMGCRNHSAKGD